MSNQTKRSLALLPFKDAHMRGAYKRMMIEAEVAASIRPKATKSKDVNNMPVNDAV